MNAEEKLISATASAVSLYDLTTRQGFDLAVDYVSANTDLNRHQVIDVLRFVMREGI